MERDDIIEYSLDAHHSEEAGKKIRAKIWKVTFILTLITAVEVVAGILWPRNAMGSESTAWMIIKLSYILLTLLKAGYIVMVFMHLGDERKSFKWMILAPYILFIVYLMFIAFTEGGFNNASTQEIYEGPGKAQVEEVLTPEAATTDAPAEAPAE